MKKEIRTVVYDEALRIEAYRFEGIVQPFPNHFHDFYVIGLVEAGERFLTCKNREYVLCRGDMVLFHPGDNHACAQNGDEALDYRALNIPREVMLDLAEEATGERALPGFSKNVVRDAAAACYLHALHEQVMKGSAEFDKEENLFLLFSTLMQNYGRPFAGAIPECGAEIERACAFMQANYAEAIRLDQLCRCAGLSKSTLLRAFAKGKGVTPYRYLEAVRINEAKKLMEGGALPIEAALQTGFADQSHFANAFRRFIGLTPGAYREIFIAKGEAGGK